MTGRQPPAELARTATDLHGNAGRAWLADLPRLVAGYERRWGFVAGPPFPDLSYTYVVPGRTAGGEAVVLKLAVPGTTAAAEAAALRHYAGRGAVRLRAADEAAGALLLERALPGTPLTALVDEADGRATAAAADVMAALWRPPPPDHDFPTVADWGRGFARLRARFDGGTGPLPPNLVARSESLYRTLAASAAAPVLLHGDLHHGNILAAERGGWLTIDPKGLVGEPAYEVGALLRNPLPWLLGRPDAARLLERRIAILADRLALDRARLRDWGLAQAVLSAWWSIEDHGVGWEPAIACAELLAALSP